MSKKSKTIGAPSTPPAEPPTTPTDQAAPPVRRTKPLRRWSIAELIARAVVPPRADGLRQGQSG